MERYLVGLLILILVITGSCTYFLHTEATKAIESFEEVKKEHSSVK